MPPTSGQRALGEARRVGFHSLVVVLPLPPGSTRQFCIYLHIHWPLVDAASMQDERIMRGESYREVKYPTICMYAPHASPQFSIL